MTDNTQTQTQTQNLTDLLTSNYMLANLTVRTWGATKTDNAATDELLVGKHAEMGSARVVKNLFGANSPKLKATIGAYNYIRTWYYAHSVAWAQAAEGSDRRGARLVGVAQAMEFLTRFAALKTEAETVRDEFLSDYEQAVQEMQAKLGELYDASEYPTRDEVRVKFGAVLSIDPIPSGADFSKTSIPAELAQGLQRSYEARAVAQVETAAADVQERILRELERFTTQLSKVVNGDKVRLHKSLVSNFNGLVSLAESLAPVAPQLEDVAIAIKDELLEWSVEDFKDNAPLARDAIIGADKVRRMMAAAAPTAEEPNHLTLDGSDDAPVPVDEEPGLLPETEFDMDSVFDGGF
jgi:hypothetical protein